MEFLYSLDKELLYFINQTLSAPFLDKFFSTITNVNNWYITYVVLLLSLMIKGGRKGRIAAIGIIILIAITDQLSHNVIKELVQRIRPCNELPDILTPLGCTGSYSFPSNHAVNNFAVAFFFYRFYPNYKYPLFITAFLVAISRVYLGLHYPSDVLGGALIGSLAGYYFSLLLSFLDLKYLSRLDLKSGLDGKLTIRGAVENDIPVLLKLTNELAEYEKLSDEVKLTEEKLRQFLFGRYKYAEALIAEYDGAPAGHALYFYNFSTFAGKPGIYLEDLFVQPHLRGKGIGRLLLEALIEKAKREQLGRVEWAVLDWNEQAIKFYKKRGAIPMQEWIIFRLQEDKF